MAIQSILDLIPRFEIIRRERRSIKMVSCLIRPEKLQGVVESLNKLGLVGGMTVSDVRGCGRQEGEVELYRGEELVLKLLAKVRVDLAVPADDVERVMEVIRRSARTEAVGDGKIFITDVVKAMRIRTGEKGMDAL